MRHVNVLQGWDERLLGLHVKVDLSRCTESVSAIFGQFKLGVKHASQLLSIAMLSRVLPFQNRRLASYDEMLGQANAVQLA